MPVPAKKRATVLSKMLDHARTTLRQRENHAGWSEDNRQMWRDRVQVLKEILVETCGENATLKETFVRRTKP